MEFFEGFKWPVPSAFKDALAKCRFELGDTLYNEKIVYLAEWGKAKETQPVSIQVTFPLKSVAGGTSAGSSSVFKSNWNSRVEFELTDRRMNNTRRISTFQGNLYTLLREGDLSCLEDPSPAPMPSTAADIGNRLEKIQVGKKSASQFIMSVDETSDILVEKVRKIQKQLDGKAEVTQIPAHEIDILKGENILPTVKVVVFDCELQSQEMEQLIKDAVYVPVKNKKTDRERFRLRDHGLLL